MMMAAQAAAASAQARERALEKRLREVSEAQGPLMET